MNILFLPVLALYLLAVVPPVFAQSDNEKKFLLMYFTAEELTVEAPTRSVKPVSRTAENVTVVTANDIELMNAHTVGDVLNTVTGVQVVAFGGPGSGMAAFIQGSEQRHVAVFIDGIPVNNLSDNITDLGLFPVQNVEKIEIIKGPASSAWGSALGGAVNIITKSGRNEKVSGAVSASYGEKDTGDFRSAIFGKEGSAGYYLDAGRLQTDGFGPHFDVSTNNAYLKLHYDLADKAGIQYTLGYIKSSRGAGAFSDFNVILDEEVRNIRSAFSLHTTFDNNLEIHLLFWSNRLDFDRINSQQSSGAQLARDSWDDNSKGASAVLSRRNDTHNLVFGFDSDSKSLESNRILGGKQAIRKSAVYLNDTVSLSKLSITPGIRYDDTSKGNATSPSIGITYNLTDTTVLRAFTAKGFSIPPLAYLYGQKAGSLSNPDLKMEQVTSYQIGAETAVFKYFWVKLSAFRHDVRDAILLENNSGLGIRVTSNDRQKRDGVEFEVKTAPVYNTSLAMGAEYVDIRDMNTGLAVLDTPRLGTDVGLLYDDEHSFKALLKGRYIDWHMVPETGGSYGNFVFVLNLVKNIHHSGSQSLEVFLTAHNLFNGDQYPIFPYKNPARWAEGGLRCRF